MSKRGVPASRVRTVNGAPVRGERRRILYWMQTARRASFNYALDRAAEWSRQLNRPLLVLESLFCDEPFASDRFHRFVLQGMADNAAAFSRAGVAYYPYAEPRPGICHELLRDLARESCVVLTDDFPSPFSAARVSSAGAELDVRVEAVDSNGLLPLSSAPRAFLTAASFRRLLQSQLPGQLSSFPAPSLRGSSRCAGDRLPKSATIRWPAADHRLLSGELDALAALPIDHDVPLVKTRGGTRAGRTALRRFVRERLHRYLEHNHPDAAAVSELSPWLHYGHLSAHEVFLAVARAEEFRPERLGKVSGHRAGYWGMSEAAESFLDELLTWRELAFNTLAKRPNATTFDSLPPWACETLTRHAGDPRPHRYERRQLESAQTHDPLWNAAQRQLLRDGWIHGYLRMIWGKRLLEWSPSPQRALELMLSLNDRWALDGRDPNSVGGISWVLGRYDRPWGPERPIFGKVRYMSSANTLRKLRLSEYLRRFG